MDIKEAISILDPSTTAQTLARIEYYAGFSGRTAAVQAVTDACIVACNVMREKLEQDGVTPVTRLAPLTLTETAQMGYDPKWVELRDNPNGSKWSLGSAAFPDKFYFDEYTYLRIKEYGNTWRCWAAKPSEEEQSSAPWEVN